jgi:hypothetical protein
MSEPNEVHQLIYKYIFSYDAKGEEILKNIFGKQLKKPEFDSLRISSDYFDDLFYSFYEKKIIKKRNIFKERFENDKKGLISFLQKTIYNFLQDERDKNKINEVRIYTKEDEDITDIILKNPNQLDLQKYIEAKEIVEHFNEFFTEEDKKIFCYIFFKDKIDRNYCVENLNRNVVYKRVERIKKDKFPKFIETYGITYSGFQLFEKEFLMSEICKKVCL